MENMEDSPDCDRRQECIDKSQQACARTSANMEDSASLSVFMLPDLSLF